MGLEKMIKREISITIAVVLLITTIFIMFSYAVFKVEDEGEHNTITFGQIAMTFCKDSSCAQTEDNIGNVIGTKAGPDGTTTYVPIYPRKTTENDDYSDLTPYTFQLENTGDLPLYIKVFLEKDNAEGTKITQDGEEYSTQVDDDQIMIAFGESTAESKPTSKKYSETVEKTVEEETQTGKHVIGENIILNAGEKKTFKLYAWLVDNAKNDSQGKIFVTKISAKGEYVPKHTGEADQDLEP